MKPARGRADRERRGARRLARRGFSLLELLVVIAMIALLSALLVPVVSKARTSSRRAGCLSNLHQIGVAVHSYAQYHDGRIPYGPTAPPFSHPADFYPSTGSPTSLLSLRGSGAPVGLGLLLSEALAQSPKALFCPGGDQSVDAATELARVGITQVQGSYYYRHGGVTALFTTPPSPPDCTRLEAPGLNRQGRPIRALAMDTQFLCSDSVATYNVRPRTHHQQAVANTLFYDGSARALDNRDGRFTVDLRSNADLYDAFNRILLVLEKADDAI